MNEKQIIKDFHNLIVNSIITNKLNENSEKLKNDLFIFNEKVKEERIRREEKKKGKNKIRYNITSDIFAIRSDLIYLTAILFTLKKYINNPTKEVNIVYSKKPARYHQNLYDSLYMLYVSISYEKLYNFWDRIGDKLANEFPKSFPNKKSIMFANVIEKLNKEFYDCSDFIWLYNFKLNDFRDFNNVRKIIVHYEHIETSYKKSIFENSSNLEIIRNIYEKKQMLPIFFKKHIKLMDKGIFHTYNFIKKIRTTTHCISNSK